MTAPQEDEVVLAHGRKHFGSSAARGYRFTTGCSLLDCFLMSALQGGLISNDKCTQITKLALITSNDT